MTVQRSEVRVFGAKPKTIGRIIRGVLALIVVLLVALVVFGGPFARGIAVGAFGSVGVAVGFALVMRAVVMRRTRRGGREQPFAAPPLPNQTWDYAMELTDLEGVAVRLEAHRDSVLVLNMWATWCAPCVAEMPSLHRLRDRTADAGVRFAFISREPVEKMRPFVEKHGWKGDLYRMEGDPPAVFPLRGIPATYVIDRGGRIVLRHMGAARWDDDSVVAFLRGLALAASL